ncbi:MAG TPA: hypothetical protein VKY70_00915 [Pseudomonas sp.]|nr:hypothetical protein [Pseudomonas sp.]
MSGAVQQELIVVPKESALEVFTKPGGLEPYLGQIKAAVTGIVPDLSTKKGRDAIASLAYKVSKSKTYLDGVGKELVDEYKEIPKKIDAARKQARDFLDQLRDEVRRPLTEWENAEKARIERHQQAIRQINLRLECRDLDSTELQTNIEWLEGLTIDESWEEFQSEAAEAKEAALAALREARLARWKYEAEQAELARLRAEAAAREQQEREERIAREAAERAAREARESAERQVREAQEAAQRAELERQQAEQRAAQAAEAERQRIAAEQREAEEAARRREADREHRRKVNTAALNALVNEGVPIDCAKLVITAIAQRRIPAVTITY